MLNLNKTSQIIIPIDYKSIEQKKKKKTDIYIVINKNFTFLYTCNLTISQLNLYYLVIYKIIIFV